MDIFIYECVNFLWIGEVMKFEMQFERGTQIVQTLSNLKCLGMLEHALPGSARTRGLLSGDLPAMWG